VTMCGQRLDCVDKFVYLGVAFSTRKSKFLDQERVYEKVEVHRKLPNWVADVKLGCPLVVACLVTTSVWFPKLLYGCEVQQIDTARMSVTMARLGRKALRCFNSDSSDAVLTFLGWRPAEELVMIRVVRFVFKVAMCNFARLRKLLLGLVDDVDLPWCTMVHNYFQMAVDMELLSIPSWTSNVRDALAHDNADVGIEEFHFSEMPFRQLKLECKQRGITSRRKNKAMMIRDLTKYESIEERQRRERVRAEPATLTPEALRGRELDFDVESLSSWTKKRLTVFCVANGIRAKGRALKAMKKAELVTWLRCRHADDVDEKTAQARPDADVKENCQNQGSLSSLLADAEWCSTSLKSFNSLCKKKGRTAHPSVRLAPTNAHFVFKLWKGHISPKDPSAMVPPHCLLCQRVGVGDCPQHLCSCNGPQVQHILRDYQLKWNLPSTQEVSNVLVLVTRDKKEDTSFESGWSNDNHKRVEENQWWEDIGVCMRRLWVLRAKKFLAWKARSQRLEESSKISEDCQH